MKKLHLLGFSGSILSLILNTLKDLNQQYEIDIVKNTIAEDEVPFENGLDFTIRNVDEWELKTGELLAFAVFKPEIKQLLFDVFANGRDLKKSSFANLIHPSVSIASTAEIYSGFYADPGCIISPFAKIGFGVSLNRNSSIGHHTRIGDFSTISPGVNVAGHCDIGEVVSIGIGACVFDHVTIGKGSIIGGGSVVTRDIPENVVAWGNPCKVVKSRMT